MIRNNPLDCICPFLPVLRVELLTELKVLAYPDQLKPPIVKALAYPFGEEP
jgi:hypothetical protein